MMKNLRKIIFRIWYWYVNTIDKKGEVLFMNYGYSNPDMPVNLEPEDEANRYSAQLYHLVGSAVDLKNKDIAEIGCGRGGGLSYITKVFSPASALGVDLDKQAIIFCSKQYTLKGIKFEQGDAQNLFFLEDNSVDAIINVESSHRYPDMNVFLKEVHRVLRPGGNFLYTDFRYAWEEQLLKQQLTDSGMNIIKEEMITEHVLSALKADDERKRRLVKKLAPAFIHSVALNFAGTVGSSTFNKFASHEFEYYHFVMQKNF